MSNINEQFKKIFIESWTSVCNTALGRNITLVINSIQVKTKKDAAQLVRGLQSFISITYGELPGEFIILGMRNKLISIIANLLIGQDSFKDSITPTEKDVFAEIMNQIFTACHTPLKEAFDLDMRFRDIKFVESGEPLQIINGDNLQLWICTITFTGMAAEKFIIAAPENFAEFTIEDEDRIGKIMIDPLSPKPNIPKIPNIPAAKVSTLSIPPTPSTPMTSPQSPIRPRAGIGGANIDLLIDVEIPITVRIGTTEMKLIDIMRLGLGSIIELEKMVDDPVEILANNKLVAKGEIVTCDGNYAVKIIEVQSKEERIRSLA